MQICGICKHGKHIEINKLLDEGTSIRKIAGQYGFSPSAVARHKAHREKDVVNAVAQNLMKVDDQGKALVPAVPQRSVVDIEAMLDELVENGKQLKKALKDATRKKNYMGMASLQDQIIKLYNFQLKVVAAKKSFEVETPTDYTRVPPEISELIDDMVK
jgi:IS30 family transposase